METKKIDLNEIIARQLGDYTDKEIEWIKLAMLDFGRQLLATAAEDASIEEIKVNYTGVRAGGYYMTQIVNKSSILNAIKHVK